MDQNKTAELHGTPISASPRIASDGSELDVDRSAFDSLAAEIGRADALQTFSVFFNETENRLKRLRELSCDEDRNAIAHEAHALKGSAASFGLRKVSDLARTLEQNARSITSNYYDAALRGLETSYAAAYERFAELVA